MKKMKKEIAQLIEEIKNIDNDDNMLPRLESAAEFYCSSWDQCEGLKRALILTLEDQYTNHEHDTNPSDIALLKSILQIE